MFDAKCYQARRQALREAVPDGIVLIPGNGESPINFAANPHPFRQDSTFLYYFGLDAPDLVGFFEDGETDGLLAGPDPSPDAALWTGPAETMGELAERAGVRGTMGPDELRSRVSAALDAGVPVHFLPPYRDDQVLRLGRLTGLPPDRAAEASSAALVRAVVAMRSIKSAEEIAEVETALSWTATLFQQVARRVAPGRNVLELAGEVDRRLREWSTRTAFPMIMTPRGEVLHGRTVDRTLEPSQLLLVDMGVESPRGYASDVTRTFPVGGRFSSEQRDLYRIVLAAQSAAIALMAPGTAFVDVHMEAARTLAAGLADLGLMKGDPAAAVAEDAHALFFPHGLGHLLGLDVHDMEGLGEDAVGYDETIQRQARFGLASLRFGRRLEAGHILTVEPGIYFIPALIDRWEAEGRASDFIDYGALRRFRHLGGIRIEDDVLVTESGCRVLGPAIPKSIETVEAVVGRPAGAGQGGA